jgi:HSP20 family protein
MRNSLVRQSSPFKNSFFQRSGLPRVFDMMNEMDQLFNQWPTAGASDSEEFFSPAIDVSENEKEYVFNIDAPGVKEKDINISVTGRQLSVTGERRRETEEKSERSYRSERVFGRFERSFMLPEEVNVDQIDASFRDGVLEIRVPKVEAAQPKTIAIKSSRTADESEGRSSVRTTEKTAEKSSPKMNQ